MSLAGRKRVGPGVALAVCLLVCTPLRAAAADQGVDIIGIGGGYSPSSVTVDPGNTVTWTNRDQSAAHNAVCSAAGDGCPVDMSPDGGKLEASGKTQSFTFQYSGTYNYHCSAHANMRGTVVVTGNVHPPASTSSTAPPASGGDASRPSSGNSGGTVARGPVPAQGATTGGAPTRSSGLPGAPSTATDTQSTGQAVRESLAGVNLPRPNVVLKTAAVTGTPRWVLLTAAGALLVAALLFGLAWFGPPLGQRGRAG